MKIGGVTTSSGPAAVSRSKRSYRTRHAPLDLTPASEPPSPGPARISGSHRPEFSEPTGRRHCAPVLTRAVPETAIAQNKYEIRAHSAVWAIGKWQRTLQDHHVFV